MTQAKKTAKTLVAEMGAEPAQRYVMDALHHAGLGSDFKQIEAKMFWREVMVELLKLNVEDATPSSKYVASRFSYDRD